MLGSQVVPVAAGASGLIVTAVLSVPCVSSLLNRLTVRRRQYQSLPAQYEDEDGTATEESTRSFSTIAPRIMTLLLAIAGFSVSLASAVLETISFGKLDYIRRWLGFALWVSHLKEKKSSTRNLPLTLSCVGLCLATSNYPLCRTSSDWPIHDWHPDSAILLLLLCGLRLRDTAIQNGHQSNPWPSRLFCVRELRHLICIDVGRMSDPPSANSI